MASGRRRQNEINLGPGHIAGMFLAVVVLCGIFFSLGYVIGRGGSSRKAAGIGGSSPGLGADGNATTGKGEPVSTRWDFFPKKSSSSNRSHGTPTPGLTLQPSGAAHPAARAAKRSAIAGPISMSPKAAGLRIERKPPPLTTGGEGVLLQVAAIRNQADALALAGFLKQKGYPAFAWGPSTDRLYRVQVGPYRDSKAAGAARLTLEKEGFKSILKK